MCAGYWGKPELSEEVFRARLEPDDGETYLRTGDEGYFEKGTTELYVCGRLKDLIIVGGKNYYPEDVEHAINDACPDVRPGCIASFAMEVDDQEAVVVVCEIRRAAEATAELTCQMVREVVQREAGIAVDRVVAIKERTIPKTTSGKIQRRATRTALEDGLLRVVWDTSANRRRATQAAVRKDSLPVVHATSVAVDTALASAIGAASNPTFSIWSYFENCVFRKPEAAHLSLGLSCHSSEHACSLDVTPAPKVTVQIPHPELQTPAPTRPASTSSSAEESWVLTTQRRVEAVLSAHNIWFEAKPETECARTKPRANESSERSLYTGEPTLQNARSISTRNSTGMVEVEVSSSHNSDTMLDTRVRCIQTPTDATALASEMFSDDARFSPFIGGVATAMLQFGTTQQSILHFVRKCYVESVVQDSLSVATGTPNIILPADTFLVDTGLTSLMSWELVGTLEKILQVSVVVTQLVDSTVTIADLANRIVNDAAIANNEQCTAVVTDPNILEARHILAIVRDSMASSAQSRLVGSGTDTVLPCIAVKRKLEANGVFPFAVTRFQNSSAVQTVLFALWVPVGLVLAAFRMTLLFLLLMLSTPSTFFDHLWVVMGVHTLSRRCFYDFNHDSCDDSAVTNGQPTLFLVDHHFTLDLLLVSSDLARHLPALNGRRVVPCMLAHDKLRSTFGRYFGSHVLYGSGSSFLTSFEEWLDCPDSVYRPMLLSPTGQTTKRPYVTLPSIYFLNQQDRVQTVIASVHMKNPFGLHLRTLEGSATIDTLLALMMPWYTARLSYRVVPKSDIATTSPTATSTTTAAPLQAWCRSMSASGNKLAPYTQALKAKCSDLTVRINWLDSNVLRRLIGSRATTLYVCADCVAPDWSSCHSKSLLDMIQTARLECNRRGTAPLTLVVVTNSIESANAERNSVNRLSMLGLKPDRFVCADSIFHSREDGGAIVICTGLAKFYAMGFKMELDSAILQNPDTTDCLAAVSFDLPVHMDDAVAPYSLAHVARSEAFFNASLQSCLAKLPSGLRVSLVMTSNGLHWILKEKHMALLGCLLIALRESGPLVLSIAQAYVLTHPIACYFWKILIPRPRPFWLADGYGQPIVRYWCPRDTEVTDASFTSGHTVFITTILVVSAYHSPSTQLHSVLATLTVCTALARVCAGAHYLSDVIVGALASCICNIVLYESAVLPRQGESSSLLFRFQADDIGRQFLVTGAVVIANASLVCAALFVSQRPPALRRKYWARNYQEQLETAGLVHAIPVIHMHKLEHMLSPYFGMCATVFWMPAALSDIYETNHFCPYSQRSSVDNCVAVVLSGCAFYIFCHTSRILSRTSLSPECRFVGRTALYASLFLFQFLAIESIVVAAFHSDKRWRTVPTFPVDCGFLEV